MCHCMGWALDEWGLIDGALIWFQSHTGPCIHQTLSLWTANCPITHTAKSFSVHLLTQAKTNYSFFLSPFMLRHTSIHSYDIPEEANTGGRCAWSVQQHGRTRPSSGVQGSQRECRQTLFSTIWHSAHKHTDALPVLLYFPAFRFVKFLSQALSALFRTHIMSDCCICICIQKQANGNAIQHVCYGTFGYTGSVLWANNYWTGNPKFAGSNLRDDSFYEGSCWLFFNMDLEICGSKHGFLEMFKV